MEFNFKSNSPYSYMKYGGYRGEYKGKEYYLVPCPEDSINIRDLYDMFSKIDVALVDLLNMGRICLEDDAEMTKFTCALMFAEKHGLLGFMAEAPVNPDFMLDKEVALKDDNVIDKNCVMKTSDYFKKFFPFATKEEMSYSIVDNKVEINTNSDLQKLLVKSPLNEQLIFSNFYCEQVDWIVNYAIKMYRIFKKTVELSNNNINPYDDERELVANYSFSGVPYKINMYGQTPEICWQPNSLKQALDMSLGFMLCSEKNSIKICKHCGRVFYANNPKAEYCSSQCRNKANVYKSRSRKSGKKK